MERCLCFPPVKLFPVTCEYIQGEKQFYYRAQRFYEDVPASEEGMMGDFVEISNADLEGSRQFLKRFVVSHSSGLHVRCILDEDLTKTKSSCSTWPCAVFDSNTTNASTAEFNQPLMIRLGRWLLFILSGDRGDVL